MRRQFAIIALAASVTGAASADFTGYSVTRILLGNGHVVMNVYANFDHAGDRVINVYRSNITTSNLGGFYQSAANPFWKPGTQNESTSDDSWVTIDTNPNGNGNASGSITAADPNFVNFDDLNESTNFAYIQSAGNGAGWYNAVPSLGWGFAEGGHVLLAHFVAVSVTLADVVSWDARMVCNFVGDTGAQTNIGGASGSVFPWMAAPGPGALGLLGIASFNSRRRRMS